MIGEPSLEVRSRTAGEVHCGTVDEAIAALGRGEFVVVADGVSRESAGQLIMPAERVTTEAMVFLVRHTSGLVCVAVEPERLDWLRLPLMVPCGGGGSGSDGPAFTVSTDFRDGLTTGISARERAATVRALADPAVGPDDFVRPGHVFALRARPFGVLEHAGQTEAAVDLARLSGAAPAGVLCGIVNDDGSMARGPELVTFAGRHGFVVIAIDQLIAYRCRTERLVERVSGIHVETDVGPAEMYAYRALFDGVEHLVVVVGDLSSGEPVPIAVHVGCLAADLFGSNRCDCGARLRTARQAIADAGRGVLVCLSGRAGHGIGLSHERRAGGVNGEGWTEADVDATPESLLDRPECGVVASILRDLRVAAVRPLMADPGRCPETS